MKEPKTGVQLYTLRDYIQTAPDFDRTLSRLQQMGVCDIQISGIGGDIPADEIARIVQKYDMHVCVTHQSYDRLCNDLPGVIELHQKIGCDAVGLGCGPSESRAGLESAKAFVKNLEAIAKNLAAHGLRFHYHNHDFEFRAFPGTDTTLWDLLLDANPDLIHFIPDIAWMHVAGKDPAAMLETIADRVKVVHFKDYVPKEDGSPRFVSLGQGVVDLKACFAVCREKEIPYIVYEQDNSWEQDDPFMSTQTSLDYFETLHAMD